jgi:hypothetical protein
MVKIILPLFLLLIFCGCGKRGDIPKTKSDLGAEPAKIDKERIYKF